MTQESPSADPSVDPAQVIRPAATVLLLREDPEHPDDVGPVQVYVIRRVADMVFAGGATAFPGGAIDPSDADATDVQWAGPGPDWWADRLDLDAATARGSVLAAVRELFEETGLLFAGTDAQVVRQFEDHRAGDHTDVPGGWSEDVAEQHRADLAAHRRSIAALLAAERRPVRDDLLRPWARWITPPGRTRRYDTVFFLGLPPVGVEPRLVGTEAEHGDWQTPAAILAAELAGQVKMMTPTRAVLRRLAAAGSLDELRATDLRLHIATEAERVAAGRHA
ncbi:NUDIX hydrolase [Nakamurella leprariae]|uniref:NUDIX hydrolase n=1 Tax=Nakamurella leprariae TaxID=2803911 RepID=A0A938YD47_9ACTN|nr:NUDIX hydrolase [Nakamurella leprariae]MBM9467391.1 NUDIX hydrolase [Nakamurella leprariae]